MSPAWQPGWLVGIPGLVGILFAPADVGSFIVTDGRHLSHLSRPV